MTNEIVLATRFGGTSAEPARAAAGLARLTGGGVTVVYVATELNAIAAAGEAGVDPAEERARLHAGIQEQLDAFVHEHFEGLRVNARVVQGDIAETVAAVAAELNASYLVVGTRGRGQLARLILGDTTQSILHHTPCPVLVVPLRHEG